MTAPADLAVRLYAAMRGMTPKEAKLATECMPASAQRLAACAEAIIAERIKEARLETLRSAYNVVCREFSDPGLDDYDAGVTTCRDAIAKLIEGEIP